MSKTLKLTISQFNAIQEIAPVVEDGNKELKKEIKFALLNSVQDGLTDKWYNVKENTKEALKYACMLSVEQGFFYCSPTHLSKKFKISVTTVYAIFKELVDAKVLYKVNRSATKHNGKGKAVYFFTKHPNFKAICDFLGVDWKANCNTDCKAEIAVKPTLPTSESVPEASTLSLTTSLQNTKDNVKHSNVVDYDEDDTIKLLKRKIEEAEKNLKDKPYEPTAPKFIKYVPKEINKKFGYFGDMLTDIWRKIKLAERKVNNQFMTKEIKLELACEVIQNLKKNSRFKVMSLDEMCAYVYKAHLNAMFNYLAELNVSEGMFIDEEYNYYAYLITVDGRIDHVHTNSENDLSVSSDTEEEDTRSTVDWWEEEVLSKKYINHEPTQTLASYWGY